jgi:hypothetical protein
MRFGLCLTFFWSGKDNIVSFIKVNGDTEPVFSASVDYLEGGTPADTTFDEGASAVGLHHHPMPVCCVNEFFSVTV